MSALTPEYRQGNLCLPALGLWLDPREPQKGDDVVFVSHAHYDHIARHREVILSAATALLMRMRMPGQRKENVVPFGRPISLHPGEVPFTITLLPAGHILGSAMALIEAEGESLLYTGDFKLRPGLSAEPCEPRAADYLVMETTFGRPHYVFPAAAEVLKGIIRFCREALDEEQTPVLLGYSLGKSQEILCALSEAGLPLMLHESIYKPVEVYKQFGARFPQFEAYRPEAVRGKVLLCPPAVVNSAMLRNLGPARTAILTGWAADQNCRYRYQCDAAFPLSDHADFPELLEMVRSVAPKRVYTLHGFAADFAQTLRNMGFKAQALSEQEQFSFGLGIEGAPPAAPAQPAELRDAPAEAGTLPGGTPFAGFAETCANISAEAAKLEKARLVAGYLRSLEPGAINMAVTWFTGRPFAAVSNRALKLGWSALRDAICNAAGVSPGDFQHVYLKHSDPGETAFELLGATPVGPGISIAETDTLFNQLEAARGPLAKTPLLTAALRRCSPLEAKFLIKIITGDLRIGLKEGLMEDAVAMAFDKTTEEVRNANLLIGNIGETALLARSGSLENASLVPFRPFKFMLASPEESAQSAWERLNAGRRMQARKDETPDAAEPAETAPLTVWVEDKYDGVRCQLHKVGERVSLFSRDLKEITATFEEVAEAVRQSEHDFIADGEIVAMRQGAVLPFSDLQRRLGRRDTDLFMQEEVPVRFVAFDLIWHAGQTLLNEPLSIRRNRLETIAGNGQAMELAKVSEARAPEELDALFTTAREQGNEGLVIKDPQSPYAPGRRGLSWLKLKKALATLDCVIVGAEYGHGKRSGVLSDYTFAVRDEQSGDLKIIGKAFSGLTDAEIEQLTARLLRIARRQQGRYIEVRPEVVLEIAFDRIQPSTRHNSGLAMRFPRIVRIIAGKPAAETDTLAAARKIAGL